MFNPMSKLDSKTKQLLKDPVKRRAWVKYQTHLLGMSMAQVADNAGVNRQTLYSAFFKTYPRMEKVIADALGLEPAELWPERYDADGLPIYRMGRPVKKSITKKADNTSSKRQRNVQSHKSDRHEDAA